LQDGSNYNLRAIARLESGQQVTSIVYTVTVDSASGGKADGVVENSGGGNHVKESRCNKDETAEVVVYDGTVVIMPAGAVESNVTLRVELTGTSSNAANGSASGKANINANREVSMDGHPTLEKPIEIVIPYPDADDDGIVDGTSVRETTLSAYSILLSR
jgi:hypothetical protein